MATPNRAREERAAVREAERVRRLEDHIKRVVAEAPPLSSEQASRLAVLLNVSSKSDREPVVDEWDIAVPEAGGPVELELERNEWNV